MDMSNFLERMQFASSDSNMQGTVRVGVADDGTVSFFNALTNEKFESFSRASADAKMHGLTEFKTTTRNTVGRFNPVANQRLAEIHNSLGAGHSVESMSLSMTNRAMVDAVEKHSAGLIIDDGSDMRIVRIKGPDGRIFSRDETLKKLRDIGIVGAEAESTLGKFGKRMNGVFAPREMDANIDGLKIGVFDPNKMSGIHKHEFGVGIAFENQIEELVESTYKDKKSLADALRMQLDGSGDEYGDPGKKSFAENKKKLKEILTLRGRDKAFDGAGLVSVSAVRKMAKEIEKRLEDPTLSQSQRKMYQDMLDRARNVQVGEVYNARFAGEQIDALNSLGGEAPRGMVAGKGNLVVTEDTRMSGLAGTTNTPDVLVSTANRIDGLSASEYLAFDSGQKAKLNPKIDILSAIQSGLITENDAVEISKDIESVIDTLNRLRDGKAVSFNSRGYSAIEASLEAQADARNPRGRYKNKLLLERLRSGQKLNPEEMADLASTVSDSLTKMKRGKEYPSARIANADSSPILSEAIINGANANGDRLALGADETVTTKNARVISNLASSTRHSAFGGFDHDDKVNAIYRRDRYGNVVAAMYRQPNAAAEAAIFNVKDPMKDVRLRALAERWALDQAWGDPTLMGVVNMEIAEGSDSFVQDYIKSLERVDEGITLRGFDYSGGRLKFVGFGELTAEGVKSYPGAENIVGKRFEYSLSNIAEDKIDDITESLVNNGRAIDRVRRAAEVRGALGSWVNARGALDAFVQTNASEISAILGDTDHVHHERVGRLMKELAEQEDVIDTLKNNQTQGAERVMNRAQELWEEITSLTTADDTNFKVNEYYFEMKAPSGQKEALKKKSKTKDVYKRGTYDVINDAIQDTRDQIKELVANGYDNSAFKGLQVSRAAVSDADAVMAARRHAVDAVREAGLSGVDEAGRQLGSQAFHDAFFDLFEDGKFGPRAARAYAVLARRGDMRRYGAGLAVAYSQQAHETLGLVEPTGPFGDLLGESPGVSNRASGFRPAARRILGDLLDEAETAGPGLHRVGKSALLVDDSGRVSPLSSIVISDDAGERMVRLGELMEELPEVGPVRTISGELVRGTADVEPVSYLNEVMSKERTTIARGGFMERMGEALDGGLFSSRGNLKKAAIGALTVVAGSMMYNSSKDREYTRERVLNEDMDYATTPYDQGLAMTGPAAAARASVAGGGVSYRIRTRGGSFGEGFLSSVATITGQDVTASSYLDGLQTERKSIIRDILGA